MAVIKIKLPAARDVIIPERAANMLLDCKNPDAALIYMYLLLHGGELDAEACEARCSISRERIAEALRILSAKGLTGKTETSAIPERSDAIPEYSQTDVAEHIGSDKHFRQLVDFCEENLGKVLSTVDLQVLLGIYSWLGLPADVICLLVTSCIEETRKKCGPGRVPTMRTIEKRAKQWLRDGVLTLGAAEEYMKRMEKLGEDKRRIASMLGISGRALSVTEEKYISEWIRLEISDELIASAYDKTVVNTGSLKWGYMHKILSSWNELGFKTVADTERERAETGQESTSVTDELAAARLRELNRKKREMREG